MKAVFWTTKTVDCSNHVRAWDSVYPKAVHLTFDHRSLRNDWEIIPTVEHNKPDVVFYIGANEGRGNPKIQTFQAVRKLAPLVNLCSDAGDSPWHKTLGTYRDNQCFDLQVSIDGATGSPVDFVTLTPIDPMPFQAEVPRNIRCGFSGSVGFGSRRSAIVRELQKIGDLKVRERAMESYDRHVSFIKRCQMLLNVSYTGTQQSNHIKGRVLEAGWAGCCLLESHGSPIAEWFPSDCYLSYRDSQDASRLIRETSESDIAKIGSRLKEEVSKRFRPENIYGEILKRVGVTESRPAA